MDKHSKNIGILRNFVFDNDLMDNHSNIHFNCYVKLETQINAEEFECDAMITFDNFMSEGELTFLSHDLDPYYYPTIFKAKFNNFNLIGNELTISDKHPSDKIGEYSVKIIPLSRVN